MRYLLLCGILKCSIFTGPWRLADITLVLCFVVGGREGEEEIVIMDMVALRLHIALGNLGSPISNRFEKKYGYFFCNMFLVFL